MVATCLKGGGMSKWHGHLSTLAGMVFVYARKWTPGAPGRQRRDRLPLLSSRDRVFKVCFIYSPFIPHCCLEVSLRKVHHLGRHHILLFLTHATNGSYLLVSDHLPTTHWKWWSQTLWSSPLIIYWGFTQPGSVLLLLVATSIDNYTSVYWLESSLYPTVSLLGV